MQKCAEYLNCSGENYSFYSQDGALKFEKCDDCGLIWRSEDSMKISKPYEQDYFDSKSYDLRRKHKVKKSGWIIDLANLHHANISELLEIGCSIGYTLEAAKNRGIKHLGIDISKFAVDFCTKLGLNAKNSSLEDLKNSNSKFDLIYMQHVLEHFTNPFAVLKNCNELLNENGLVVIMVPNSEYAKAKKQKARHRFYSIAGVGSEHFVYFNYSNLKTSLEASGFKVVQQDYPILTNKYYTLIFFLNRIFRRATSSFHKNQELLIIAKKIY